VAEISAVVCVLEHVASRAGSVVAVVASVRQGQDTTFTTQDMYDVVL